MNASHLTQAEGDAICAISMRQARGEISRKEAKQLIQLVIKGN